MVSKTKRNKILQKARGLLRRGQGWTQGLYEGHDEGGDTYCVLGAVHQAVAEIFPSDFEGGALDYLFDDPDEWVNWVHDNQEISEAAQAYSEVLACLESGVPRQFRKDFVKNVAVTTELDRAEQTIILFNDYGFVAPGTAPLDGATKYPEVHVLFTKAMEAC